MTAEEKRRGTSGERIRRRTPLGGSVMVISNCRLAASGCRGISEYSDTAVRISLRELDLTVEGAGLTVGTYCGDDIEVRGRIDAVLFGDHNKRERGR